MGGALSPRWRNGPLLRQRYGVPGADGQVRGRVHYSAAIRTQPTVGNNVHAWAVITAVEWYKDSRERVSASDPWWTLDFKRRTLDGELEISSW